MAKWLLIALLPLGLAGCVTGGEPALPMALGPSDDAETCLRYADAPAFGNCDGAGAVSISQDSK
jgi:hypothetical protein